LESNSDDVFIEKNRNSLVVTFSRPEKMNAINLSMRDKIWEALELVRVDQKINAIIFTSNIPGCFSAGADINDFGSAPSIEASRKARLQRNLWKLLNNLDVPIISFVDGIAYGAGAEIAMASDWVFATSNSMFALPEIKLGYIPAAGGSQLVLRKLPYSEANKIVFHGSPISAPRLYQLGLVHKIIQSNEVNYIIDEWCSMLIDFEIEKLRKLKNKFLIISNADLK
jgi:enoyl-CoA hydratase/carnithine racemase